MVVKKMTKEELSTKRKKAIESLNDIKAILGLDELYIAELEKACDETQELLDKQIEATYKLDKENTELRDNYEQYKAVVEPEIKSLKEENAELKEKLKPENCLKLLAKEGYVKFTCENGNEHDQLTKAKEIIKKLKALYLSPVVTKDDVKRQDEILNEVEQFLKE